MSYDRPPSSPRRVPPILVGVVLSLLVLLAIASLGSYRDLVAARDRQQHLEQRIDDTRRRNDLLRGRIQRLRNDSDTLERVAREHYRMQRPGDVVIIFPGGDDGEPVGPDPD